MDLLERGSMTQVEFPKRQRKRTSLRAGEVAMASGSPGQASAYALLPRLRKTLPAEQQVLPHEVQVVAMQEWVEPDV
jgi:hypothetical protein